MSQTPGCVSADLGGETAILDPEAGLYFSLNKVGALIWDSIQQPSALSDVLGILLKEFEVDAERCTKDLLQIIGTLHERKLVQLLP